MSHVAIPRSMFSQPMSKLSLAVITALTTALTANVSMAAGLDRSGQDTNAFFQDGTYAEVVYTYLDADVTGTDSDGTQVDNIVETYDFARFGIKADVNDRVSVGVIYDEPWGAAVNFNGDNNFIAQDANTSIQKLTGMPDMATATSTLEGLSTAATTASTPSEANGFAQQAQRLGLAMIAANAAASKLGESTNVEIRSNSLTGLIGVKLGEKKNFQIYGGPTAERLKGELHLRGTTYSGASGYDSYMTPTTAMGYAVGAAFYKPEIGLKAALTYRSEIEHESNSAESVPFVDYLPKNSDLYKGYQAAYTANGKNTITITMPESVNFDFQTGLNPTTLATAHVRYVPWSTFEIRPTAYNALTQIGGNDLPILNYSEDQWKAELGLAKRLNKKLAVSGNVSWDSGAGNPITSLGPIEGYYGAGLGAKYNVTDEWAISAGGKYLWFGDAEAMVPTGDVVGKFEDNEGFVAGIKLSYQDK